MAVYGTINPRSAAKQRKDDQKFWQRPDTKYLFDGCYRGVFAKEYRIDSN